MSCGRNSVQRNLDITIRDAHEFLIDLLNGISEILEDEHKDQMNTQSIKQAASKQGMILDQHNNKYNNTDNLDSSSQNSSSNINETSSQSMKPIYNGMNYTTNTQVHQTNGFKDRFSTWSHGIPPRPNTPQTKTLKSKKQLIASLPQSQQYQLQNNQHLQSSKKQVQEPETYIQQIFEGRLVNETRCLYCESVSLKEQPFKEIPLVIQQNCSITYGLRKFRLKKLPYRVVFPFTIKLFNTTSEAFDKDEEYSLFGVVVHQGSSVNQGHYISIIKSYGRWIIFDDNNVEQVDESFIQKIYGQSSENGLNGSSQGHGYILFYMKDSEENDYQQQQHHSQQHQNQNYDKYQK